MLSDRATREILTNSVSLLKRGWCQEDIAQFANGEISPVTSESAARWCAYGAILRSSLRRSGGTHIDAFHAARVLLDANQIKGHQHVDDTIGRVADWNDSEGRTQSEVVSAMEKAANYSEYLETL